MFFPLGGGTLSGVSRANHINVVYALDAETAAKRPLAKAATFIDIGVHLPLRGQVGLYRHG